MTKGEGMTNAVMLNISEASRRWHFGIP